MAPSERNETVALLWMAIEIQLCPTKLRGLWKLSNRRLRQTDLFIVQAHASADCSSGVMKNNLYQKVSDLRKANRSNIVMFAAEHYARAGRLPSNGTRWVDDLFDLES